MIHSLEQLIEKIEAKIHKDKEAQLENEREIIERYETYRQHILQERKMYERLYVTSVGGSKGSINNTINSYVDDDYVENYFE